MTYEVEFIGGPWDGYRRVMEGEPGLMGVCEMVADRPPHLLHLSRNWEYKEGEREEGGGKVRVVMVGGIVERWGAGHFPGMRRRK